MRADRTIFYLFVSCFVLACSCLFGRDFGRKSSRLDDKWSRRSAFHYTSLYERRFVNRRLYMYVGVYEKCVQLRKSIHVFISVTEHLDPPSGTLMFCWGMVWEWLCCNSGCEWPVMQFDTLKRNKVLTSSNWFRFYTYSLYSLFRKFKEVIRSRNWDSHSGGYEEFCLLHYKAMQSVESQKMFRVNI
jgi:hypothetical protein